MHPTINQDGAHLVNADKVDISEIYGVDQKLNQLEEGRKLKEIKRQGTERGIPISKKRPPTVQHEEIKYISTKTNKYQSDFGEVTVTAPYRSSNTFSKTNTMYRKPTSFFDPKATKQRTLRHQKEEEEEQQQQNAELEQEEEEKVEAAAVEEQQTE